LAPQLT
jgi:hypothetical protein